MDRFGLRTKKKKFDDVQSSLKWENNDITVDDFTKSKLILRNIP